MLLYRRKSPDNPDDPGGDDGVSYITLESKNPPEAVVRLNGTTILPVGKHMVPPDIYTWIAEAPGYIAQSGSFSTVEQDVVFSVNLEPDQGGGGGGGGGEDTDGTSFIDLVSVSPPETVVRINGIQILQPGINEVPPDTYTWSAEAPGYVMQTGVISTINNTPGLLIILEPIEYPQEVDLRINSLQVYKSISAYDSPFGLVSKLIFNINYTVQSNLELPPGEDPLGWGLSRNSLVFDLKLTANGEVNTRRGDYYSRKTWGTVATNNMARLEIIIMQPPANINTISYTMTAHLTSQQPDQTYLSDEYSYEGVI
jgi:hypothetical protein